MTDKEKLEQSREIGRCVAKAYLDTATRGRAIERVRNKYNTLTYEDVELMWMAIDSYVDINE